jgi:hypothetical protein
LNIRNLLWISPDNEESQKIYKQLFGKEYDPETDDKSMADELIYKHKDKLKAMGYDGAGL